MKVLVIKKMVHQYRTLFDVDLTREHATNSPRRRDIDRYVDNNTKCSIAASETGDNHYNINTVKTIRLTPRLIPNRALRAKHRRRLIQSLVRSERFSITEIGPDNVIVVTTNRVMLDFSCVIHHLRIGLKIGATVSRTLG